jgi:hypothetical protein
MRKHAFLVTILVVAGLCGCAGEAQRTTAPRKAACEYGLMTVTRVDGQNYKWQFVGAGQNISTGPETCADFYKRMTGKELRGGADQGTNGTILAGIHAMAAGGWELVTVQPVNSECTNYYFKRALI